MKYKSFLFLAILHLVAACINNKDELQREVSYYPTGVLKYEVTLINGVRQGRGIDYFENGKIRAESFWKDGKLEGDHIVYYQNGEKEQVAKYRIGHILCAKDYTENGVIRRVTWFDDRERIIDYETYNSEGLRDFRRGTKSALFIADKDTVIVGETYKAEITLGNRQFDNIEVILGDVEDRKIAFKNRPLPKKDSLTSVWTVKADSVGLREITGIVIERSSSSDSMDIISFRHHFYVKSAH